MLRERLSGIVKSDEEAMARAAARWNRVAKPLHSLGLLEDALIRIAGITGSEEMDLAQKAVLVLCADNGVVCEGVTQTGSEVTAIVAENFTTGNASVCRMAQIAGARVVPVDIGIGRPMRCPGLLDRRVRSGTGNIAREPAMTREEAERAICVGIDLVAEEAARGTRVIATGEMGIGNTTTSSALASVLLGLEPEAVTGRGAGLSSDGLRTKVSVIRRALALHQPDPSDPVGALAAVGGLDIAGLAGVFLGGAISHIPIVIDGVIAAVAALVAARIEPRAVDYMLASHVSAEPAGQLLIDALGLAPVITAGMCLGEGTGAVALFPLLDMAAAVYREMTTFDENDIAQYEELK